MSQKLFFFGATGQIGFVIVQGFAARSEFQVTAAIRPDSREKHAEKIATLEAAGITLVDVIDYTDVSALTEVLTGFQTVVSTLSGAGISAQVQIVQAASAAGVDLFVPSEFGVNLGLVDDVHYFLAGKIETRKAIEESGIDYIYFITSSFASYLLGLLGVNLQEGTGKVTEGGEWLVTCTRISDIAVLLPKAVLDPAARNSTVTSSSIQPISQNQLLDVVDKVRGTPLIREEESLADLDAIINNEEVGILPRFFSVIRKILYITGPNDHPNYLAENLIDIHEFVSESINQ
eukprot:TRINITY_DN2257_c0_g4_i1.p1 TRINITY_DN2257_c0_g4~~TRINITY_DN2257_c0_g4_i1.p1  ORF type:complete len:290 (+),score=76.17 TRINITY_DN2257_c0_g4_i1:457-1326(+)